MDVSAAEAGSLSSYKAHLAAWKAAQAENLEIQAHLITHFLERETPSERISRKSNPVVQTAQDFDDYDFHLKQFLELKSLHHEIKQRAIAQYDELRDERRALEKQAEKEWKELEDMHLQAALNVQSRTGHPLNPEVVQLQLQKIADKTLEWRESNLDDVGSAYQKYRLEEALKKHRIEQGTEVYEEEALTQYEELKAELKEAESKLANQSAQFRGFTERETSAVNEVTHMNEKLERLADLGADFQDKLEETDEEETKVKSVLTKAKLRRDRARQRKEKVEEKAELLVRPRLAVDFHEKVRLRNTLVKKIATAKQDYCKAAENPAEAKHETGNAPVWEVLPEDFHNPQTLIRINEYTEDRLPTHISFRFPG
ncbi:hypothetical protein RvY_03169 [Ramazzottius varieornatus]|uniref:CCDC113/CCDC96 coiled-coil domain-containing protein n=1 Tax=Ramazzottius varieornatus TaxID=947166 RepID=A0A1D1UM69_RAMVA|nr:hypothetical protein RvY_03169 [Ramazzottius varieornatus]